MGRPGDESAVRAVSLPRVPALLLLLAIGACRTKSPLAQSETVALPETTRTFELVHVPGGKLGDLELSPFWIGKHEVTWGLFDFFAWTDHPGGVDTVSHPSKGKSYLGQAGYPPDFLNSARPVTNLRWHSAVSYCEWLSWRTGAWYRLPTEAEWEFACRAGAKGKAPENLDEVAWHQANSGESTHEGDGKKANSFGVENMLGNVWEYCLEPVKPPHYGPMVRGGAWNSPPADVTFTNRRTIPLEWYAGDPQTPRSVWWLQSDWSQGFRVVRVAKASTAKERAAYAARMEVNVEGVEPRARTMIVQLVNGEERLVKLKKVPALFYHVTGTVKNAGDRPLAEVEVMVYALREDGKPHLADLFPSAGKEDRATWSKVYPVLTNSFLPGKVRMPLQPGETRAWAVDVPFSFDNPPDVELEAHGARVTNLRFAGK